MTLPIQSTSNEEKVLAEIEQQFGTLQKKLVSYYPWAITYQLQGAEEVFFLKFIQGDVEAIINKACYVHDNFGHATPELVSYDKEKSYLLFRDHQGMPLGEDPTEQQLCRILSEYADLQYRAGQVGDQQSHLPIKSLTVIFHDFMDFLNPDSDLSDKHPGWVNADFFITPEEARNYHLALKRRETLLEFLLNSVKVLPSTLNHCDLHMNNLAENYEGQMIFLDWDDALFGPAGLSLHLVFNGCSNLFRLLDNSRELPEMLLPYQRPLQVYIQTLADRGYADYRDIYAALPATACAGLMYSLTCYAAYAWEDWSYKQDIAALFRERLEDLIALCDLLTLKDRDSLVYYANDYFQSGAPWRSAYLLEEHLQQHPNDVELRKSAGQINMQLGRWEKAISHYQYLVTVCPGQAEFLAALGDALLKNQQPELALRELEAALALDARYQPAIDALNKSVYILQCRDRARIPHLAPSIQRFPHEQQNNSVDIENLDLATAMYKEHGYVVVENLFPVDLMKAIGNLVMEKYHSYFEDREYQDNLVLGDKRRMVTLEIEGALNTPELYGNAMLDGLMQRLLSDDYVMGGLNAVVSLPGSKDQGLHKDYSPLFRSESIEHHVTPSFAVAMLTPLIDMNREHGVTSFRKGSHLVPEQMPHQIPTQEPLLKMGDGVIFDYRTAHEGLANRSNEVRPLLCIIFHRIWFRDALNYNQQKDVFIQKKELEKVPENLKHLFKWAAEK